MSGSDSPVRVPEALAVSHEENFGGTGRAWVAALPALARECLERWRLRPDGPAAHGVVALVLPVLREDGTPAALKLQPVDEETRGEPVALRAWDGAGAVRLLDADPATGAMVLERLSGSRSLSAVEDDMAALGTLAGILAGLATVPAPRELRRLSDVAAGMLQRVPEALPRLADPDDARLVDACAGAVRELLGEPGDRLLHWDLHYDNVLAAPAAGERGPWLAIDPKPLAGDPGFELFPALHNRWEDVVATGDIPRAVRRRFDLMTDVLGLDRRRATGWTLGRVLQNTLWAVESGATAPWSVAAAVARALPAG